MTNKKKYFLNAHIIDPCNSINEVGGIIIDENGKIEAAGKRVNKNNIPNREKFTDLTGKHIFPGIVDMKVFGGETGYEYKENYRSLSEAALAGGVTSVVTMPNTKPVIDSVSIVDFIQRRGRDKSKINIFPLATLTKDAEGNNMTEFGLLKNKGIVGFTDGLRSVQSSRVMSRIIKSAYDFGCLVIQHAEDQELSKGGMINNGIISDWTKDNEVYYYSGLQIVSRNIFQNTETNFSINDIWNKLILEKKLKGELIKSNILHIGDKNSLNKL